MFSFLRKILFYEFTNMIVDLKNINYDIINDTETVINNYKKPQDYHKKKLENPNKNKEHRIEYKNIMKKNLKKHIETEQIQYKKYNESNHTNETYKIDNFDWKRYVENYSDLKNIQTKNHAWEHWINFGKQEGRIFYEDKTTQKYENLFIVKNINEIENMNHLCDDWEKYKETNTDLIISSNEELSFHSIHHEINKEGLFELLPTQPIIIKKEYKKYNKHYFAWEKIIEQFIDFLKVYNHTLSLKKNVLFDDWIEKILLWGNKDYQCKTINFIKKNDCNLITFIHNPPFVKWNDCASISQLLNEIIYDNSLTNQNLIDVLNKNLLVETIEYIYTLSHNHKEYLYKNFPLLRKKLVSIYHPIHVSENDKYFEMNSFSNNKHIWHIGWWLRNFKTYIKDFTPPLGFQKNILIKKDFEINWNKISKNYDISNINIVFELDDKDYEKIFQNSCIFLDVEDSTANDIVLECIKFNTPIIVKKIPSIIEYLGNSYPLYFEDKNDLYLFNDYNYLMDKMKLAENYLKHMNKIHIQLDSFNNKIIYDLEKLNTNEKKEKLTWFCLIKNDENTKNNIENFINDFLIQDNNEKIILKFVISETFYNSKESLSIKHVINKYVFKNKNISYVITDTSVDIKYDFFINTCIYNTHTTYLTILNITDKIDKRYSNIFINYLDSTNNADIVFSSYIIKSKNNNFQECIDFQVDELIGFDKITKFPVSNTGMVFRKNVNNLVGNFTNNNDVNNIFRQYWRRSLHMHLNIICCSDEYIYIINE